MGTTSTGSMLGVYGGLSVGTTYVSTAAPTNGAIIQGNVGIGTASPGYLLHISSANAGPILAIQGGTATTYSQEGFIGTGWTYQIGVGNAGETATGVANKFFIFDANTSNVRMVVDTSGNVGIGTTSPQATLDIAGTMHMTKYSSAPYTCSSTYDGNIALTAVYTMCVCKGSSSAWYLASNGTTACTW